MIADFYDDFYHVLSACHVQQSSPSYRPFIYWLTCQLGEDITHTRIVSTIFIIITLVILFKIFNILNKARPWSILLPLTNCMVLWPFFYSSQISASISVLWASIALWLTTTIAIRKWYFLILAIFLSTIGVYLRVEVIYFYLILASSFFCFSYIKKNIETKNFFLSVNAKEYKSTLGFVIIYLLTSKIVLNWFPSSDVTTLKLTGTQYYPHSTYIFSQFYAILLYFKGLIFPFDLSFFGPWSDWIKIHENFNLKILWSGSFFFIIACCLFILLRNKYQKKIRYLFAAVFCFFISCLVLSLYQRVDWYYPMRAYLPSIIFWLFFSHFINYFKKNYFAILLLTYQIITVVHALQYKFKDFITFSNFESRHTFQNNPKTLISIAYNKMLKNENEEALALFFKAYKMIPGKYVVGNDQVIARKNWLDALYGGYIASRKLQKNQAADQALQIMLTMNSYISTLACLQDERISITICQETNRQKIFCENQASIAALIYRFHLPLRVDIQEFCKLKSHP